MDPFNVASRYGEVGEVSLLIDAGASPWQWMDNEDRTALQIVQEYGQCQVVEEILRRVLCYSGASIRGTPILQRDHVIIAQFTLTLK